MADETNQPGESTQSTVNPAVTPEEKPTEHPSDTASIAPPKESATPAPAPSRSSRNARLLSERVHRSAAVLFLIGAAIYSVYHFAWIVCHASPALDPGNMFGHAFFSSDVPSRLEKIIFDHYAAAIIVPTMGYFALALVIYLDDRSREPLEIEGLGFKFKGAAGPLILWIICFVALVSCLKMLWQVDAPAPVEKPPGVTATGTPSTPVSK